MNSQQLSKKFHSVAYACDFFDVGRTTFYSLVKRKIIKTAKIGRRTVVTTEMLEEAAALIVALSLTDAADKPENPTSIHQSERTGSNVTPASERGSHG